MKVVVLGSTGMAGHVISTSLEEKGYDVYRSSRSERNSERSRAIDVTDFKTLGEWLDVVSPDAVINCIGLLQKACDARHDLAVLFNSYLPHWLENRYAGSRTKIIHLSTDCVFSGGRGNYLEDDIPDGMTMYDRSKALGELNNDKDLTFRMSIIGPDIDPKGTGLFNWFMAQSGEIQGWHKAIWNGVTTIELAEAIDCAISQNLTGLYHLVSAKPISKHDLLVLIKDVFRRDMVQINGVEGLSSNKSLRNSRSDFVFTVNSYPDQIINMYKWVQQHAELYPHYFA